MHKYIVAYDLKNKDTEDYQTLYNLLDELNALQAQESVYLLSSSQTATVLRDIFKTHIKEDDRIIVACIVNSAWSKLIHTPKEL